MSDGTRIPGGPLTMVQALGGIAVGYVALRTAPWWAHHGPVWNVALFAAVIAGTVWLLGQLRPHGRPVSGLLVSAASVLMTPRWGRLSGRALQVPPLRSLRHRVIVTSRAGGP